MKLLDTTQYRYFLVEGQLDIAGVTIGIWRPGHCLKDELPAGDAALPVIAERCRSLLAKQYGESGASWVSVTVTEHPAPSQLIEGRIEDVFGETES